MSVEKYELPRLPYALNVSALVLMQPAPSQFPWTSLLTEEVQHNHSMFSRIKDEVADPWTSTS